MIASLSKIALMLLLTAVCFISTNTLAHTFAPALLELQELGGDRVAVRWKQPVMRIAKSTMQPVLPSDCVGVGEPEITREGTGMVASWLIDCSGGLLDKTIGVNGIASSRADVLLRIGLQNDRVIVHVLNPEQPAFTVTDNDGTFNVLRTYVDLGAEHIITGWDHLLFVVGLTLLVGGGRKLLWTVTAFTIGHSITLALAILDFLIVAPAPIEAAIAGSIFYLAVELARKEMNKPSILERAPYAIAGIFGLLHGLGFAGALREIGLPPTDIPLALFSFNVGIEIGQLLIVFIVLIMSMFLRSVYKGWPVWSKRVPAYGIGTLAVFWICERLLVISSLS